MFVIFLSIWTAHISLQQTRETHLESKLICRISACSCDFVRVLNEIYNIYMCYWEIRRHIFRNRSSMNDCVCDKWCLVYGFKSHEILFIFRFYRFSVLSFVSSIYCSTIAASTNCNNYWLPLLLAATITFFPTLSHIHISWDFPSFDLVLFMFPYNISCAQSMIKVSILNRELNLLAIWENELKIIIV